MEPDQKLKDTLAIYRDRISILKKGYAQERYRIEQLCRSFLGDIVTREVTSVDIATYRDQRLTQVNPKTQKLLSTATVRLEMSLLSNCFDIARIEWGLCDSNPVSNVRKPKIPPGRDRRMTPREERLILRYAHAHSNPELYSIIVIALQTAMRQGEILGMRWEYINLKTRVVHLPETKNGSKRDVPLSLKARDALIRLGVKSKGKVFSYSAAGLKSTWRLMNQTLDIKDLHFHDARHEAISRLFELNSLDMMEISAISGHKSLSMLKRYTHLKAHKLVRKLEGNKNKGKQVVLDHMVPYPAVIMRRKDTVTIRLLDFDDLQETAPDEHLAVRLAQDALLRRLMTSMRDATPIPPADQYLDSVDERHIIMIDPLANHSTL
ncbi:site-specific integrase [Chromobacterium subtsugae]|uniref:Site-specific integrase n=1 Tax=Chromobacterium subtsugae TaxID=251747 RepID=A0ABS7FH91_9NEIS|nr:MULTISPECIES: site-specific integrase [Chromobacterium]KUM04284.1 DNA recombinase [Chromobacterium subtsugae]KZE88362.1 DNA recombinase [Chromobacterium sp. F49]MBW7568748.1 site-specific integrase [Chromobacterium subtsugae]MBW8289422.1 site-specific integrase [Chromobacterium subtsugae]WSE90036.1 site-specific integrase [Chromobacterium subtsugae]